MFTIQCVTSFLLSHVLSLLLAHKLFVYFRLIIGILSLCISAPLTVLLLLNPVLNLTFSLLPITSSHSYASASDSTFDYWNSIEMFDWHWRLSFAISIIVHCRLWLTVQPSAVNDTDKYCKYRISSPSQHNVCINFLLRVLLHFCSISIIALYSITGQVTQV